MSVIIVENVDIGQMNVDLLDLNKEEEEGTHQIIENLTKEGIIIIIIIALTIEKIAMAVIIMKDLKIEMVEIREKKGDMIKEGRVVIKVTIVIMNIVILDKIEIRVIDHLQDHLNMLGTDLDLQEEINPEIDILTEIELFNKIIAIIEKQEEDQALDYLEVIQNVHMINLNLKIAKKMIDQTDKAKTVLNKMIEIQLMLMILEVILEEMMVDQNICNKVYALIVVKKAIRKNLVQNHLIEIKFKIDQIFQFFKKRNTLRTHKIITNKMSEGITERTEITKMKTNIITDLDNKKEDKKEFKVKKGEMIEDMIENLDQEEEAEEEIQDHLDQMKEILIDIIEIIHLIKAEIKEDKEDHHHLKVYRLKGRKEIIDKITNNLYFNQEMIGVET